MFAARASAIIRSVNQGSSLRKIAPSGRRVCSFGNSCRTRAMGTEQGGPVECAIREKLAQQFQPTYLEVINESNMHNVPRESETHFKVIVVSHAFENQSPIKRHRLVNAALSAELDGPVHALSIQAKTPSQWSSNATVTKSPPCLGGMAREQREPQKT